MLGDDWATSSAIIVLVNLSEPKSTCLGDHPKIDDEELSFPIVSGLKLGAAVLAT